MLIVEYSRNTDKIGENFHSACHQHIFPIFPVLTFKDVPSCFGGGSVHEPVCVCMCECATWVRVCVIPRI